MSKTAKEVRIELTRKYDERRNHATEVRNKNFIDCVDTLSKISGFTKVEICSCKPETMPLRAMLAEYGFSIANPCFSVRDLHKKLGCVTQSLWQVTKLKELHRELLSIDLVYHAQFKAFLKEIGVTKRKEVYRAGKHRVNFPKQPHFPIVDTKAHLQKLEELQLGYLEEILKKIEILSGYDREKICKPDKVLGARKSPLPSLRGLLVMRARMLPGQKKPSLKFIGRFLGGRDHSTVIHELEQFKDLLQVKDQLCVGILRAYKRNKSFPVLKQKKDLSTPQFPYPYSGVNHRIDLFDFEKVLSQEKLSEDKVSKLKHEAISKSRSGKLCLRTLWGISSNFFEESVIRKIGDRLQEMYAW